MRYLYHLFVHSQLFLQWFSSTESPKLRSIRLFQNECKEVKKRPRKKSFQSHAFYRKGSRFSALFFPRLYKKYCKIIQPLKRFMVPHKIAQKKQSQNEWKKKQHIFFWRDVSICDAENAQRQSLYFFPRLKYTHSHIETHIHHRLSNNMISIRQALIFRSTILFSRNNCFRRRIFLLFQMKIP